jgi:hypothetical protein
LTHRSTRIFFTGRCAGLTQAQAGRKCSANPPRFAIALNKRRRKRKLADAHLQQPINQPNKNNGYSYAALTAGYVGKPFFTRKAIRLHI